MPRPLELTWELRLTWWPPRWSRRADPAGVLRVWALPLYAAVALDVARCWLRRRFRI